MQLKRTAALVIVFGLAGCGGDVDKDKAQEQIKSGIAAQAKADVKYVKCPGGVKAEKGATFQCEALIPVNVTQVDENGNVRWQITSFSGPPGGTTGATGATGLAGATGVTAPGGAIGGATGAPPAGGIPAPAPGAAKDDSRFVKYTNRSQGYSITHPKLWKRVGSGRDVTFPFPSGSRFIHVVIQDGGTISVSDMRTSTKAQAGVQKVLEVKRDTVRGQPVTFARFTYKNPAGGVVQVIQRYVFVRGDKRALIELTADEPLVNMKPLKKKFARAISSFRWLNAGT